MAKYHISPSTGRPNLCQATKKACPLGGEDDHYSSKDEARAAYEQKQGSQVTPAVKKRRKRFTPPATLADVPTNPDFAHLESALAWAAREKKLVLAGYREGEQESEGDGYDEAPNSYGHRKQAIVALTDGKLAVVEIVAYTQGEEDDHHWEYYADVSSYAGVYDLEEGKDYFKERGNYYSLNGSQEDELFREATSHGGSRLSYDHWDYSSTKRAAQRAGQALGTPEFYKLARMERLRDPNYKLATKIVAGPNYAKSPDERMRKAVAAYPNLPREVRKELQKDSNPEVLATVARRPDMTRADFEEVLTNSKNHRDVVRSVYSNPKLPKTMAMSKLRKGTVDEFHALAENRGLDEEALKLGQRRAKELGLRGFGWWPGKV